MNTLTPKQEELLRFIERYQMKNGASPTIREMCKALKVSSDNSIIKHLDALEHKRFISRRADIARGIGLLSSVKSRLEQPALVKVPILGSIPAGGPVLSEEHIDGYLSLGADIVSKPAQSFVLRVTGDSMINAGILEGDFVVASTALKAKPGDIVIALVDGMNTVKTFQHDSKTGFHLKPENPKYSLIYPTEDLQIQGVVTVVIRHYR